jgi:phosphoribosylamine-glycine ligase
MNLLILQGGGSELRLKDDNFSNKLESDKLYQEKVIKKVLKLKEITPETNGINFLVQGYFNKGTFIKPYLLAFNYTRLMEDNRGPKLSSSGSIVYLIKENKLTSLTLEALKVFLSKVDYQGFVGLECVLSEREIFIIGFKLGFIDNITQPFTELLKIPLVAYLDKEKDLIERIEFINTIAIGVTLSISNSFKENKNNLLNVNEGARKHVWPIYHSNILAFITARGETIKEAQRRVYRTINNIVTSQDIQYRLDIGNSIEEDKNDLERWNDASV